MNQNILLSKIVANPTDTCWAQAYSTLNLYAVLSLQNDNSKSSIAGAGKEMLEKLQREYFALDNKTLADIQKAVENVVKTTPEGFVCSIILAVVIQDILYIVTSGEGMALMKRIEKLGVIAQGQTEQTLSFSGKLQAHDIIILETAGFAQKLPLSQAEKLLPGIDVTEISENLAPLVHEDALGTEASIILQYKPAENEAPVEESSEEEATAEYAETSIPENEETEEAEEERPKKRISIPSFKLLHLKLNKKSLLIPLIIILIAAFGISLFYEKQKNQEKKQQQTLATVVGPAQTKYTEALQLESLDKNLAAEDLTSAKDSLSSAQNTFPEGSAERKQVDQLLTQINQKLQEIGGGGAAANSSVLYDPSSRDIKQLAAVTFKGGKLALVGKDTGTIELLDSDGKTTNTITSDVNNAEQITADDSSYYVLTDSAVYKVAKGGGKGEKIIDTIPHNTSLDTFLGNIYLINPNTRDIEKYSGSAFGKSSYLKGTNMDNTPIALSIDSSIWVTFQNGTLKEYTKGVEDALKVQGLTTPLGKNTLIYTDQNYSNIYILDRDNARLIVMDKSGNTGKQLNSPLFKSATSFAVEENKSAYVVSGNKLYAFGL